MLSLQPEAHPALAHRIAEAVRRATGADFAIAGRVPNLGDQPVTPEVTRVADLAPLFYGHTVDMIEMTGAEVLEAQARMAEASEGFDGWVCL